MNGLTFGLTRGPIVESLLALPTLLPDAAMASASTKTAATKSILKPTMTLKDHGETIYSISYFPDGQRMISGSEDKTARLWDLEAGKEIEEARSDCEGRVFAVAVSRNGRWVATGGYSGELKVCEVETGIVKTFKGHSRTITCIDISADNTQLASGSWDETARIWNMDTGKLVAGPFKSIGGMGAVRFSPDSKKLAVKLNWGTCLEIWDIQSQKLDARIGKPGDSMSVFLSSILWTNKNKTVITAFKFTTDSASIKQPDVDDASSHLKMIYEFDASTLETVGAPFEGHGKLVTGLALSFDNALLVSASFHNAIKLWAFESRQLLASYDIKAIHSLVLSPDSRKIAYAANTKDDYKICICDIPPDVLAQARNIARKKLNLNHLLHSHSTRPVGQRKPPIYATPTVQRTLPIRDPQQPAFHRLGKLLRFSHANTVPVRNTQPRDPLDCPATLPLPSNRIRGESAPSTSLPGGSAFANPTRSSSANGKQNARKPKPKPIKVVDVPLGQATYADAVGVDDGYRPYVFFFCLSWFQKKKKKPEPPPVVYDDEVDGDDEEEENAPVPVAVPPRFQHEEIELKTLGSQSQSQPEAGPSRLAITNQFYDHPVQNDCALEEFTSLHRPLTGRRQSTDIQVFKLQTGRLRQPQISMLFINGHALMSQILNVDQVIQNSKAGRIDNTYEINL
ncbi:WD40-repeat-containing domain protein [Suillus occidentalis]|nr:WD40-repeat-containing domain protein [Suillus occidentalis]